MKNSDIPLERLFKAARRARPGDEAVAAMPSHLKTRILAHWRAGVGVDDLGLMLMGWFRRALLCGAVAMAISFAWSYGESTQEPQDYEDIANYDFRAEGLP